MLAYKAQFFFSIALVQLTYNTNGGGFVQLVVNERDASFFWASEGECVQRCPTVKPSLAVEMASRYRWALTRNNHFLATPQSIFMT